MVVETICMSRQQDLESELAFYEKNKAEYIRNHSGMYVLIKGESLIGLFPTAEAAYSDGLNKFDLQPFLVKQVLETEPVGFLPIYHVATDAGL